ncbi:hypothetical protein [Ectopseudomonas toyotomiensis]|uniref:hypothetical protein n=1 Tax=Ectopseudomonas toyotomiensis TaxID=554344 RepID=UPI0003978B79|nr:MULTISPECIES: hypothetical protein [Pseudomonas]ERH50963.1 hypothetical protein O203_12145 [Pseudomonas chengduensis]MBG0841239.1 hypothetical protein [Pseudomonas toyotomiensis]MDZ4194509.1 hypothetical protein [Pseudomonas sp.]
MANQARGTHELSKAGNIEVVPISIPLFLFTDDHGVGLVLPTQLCRVPDETGSVRVQQQIQLERHL